MPHSTLKLIPGVSSYNTQVLNMAAVNSCDLIRLTPDPGGLGLVQKLGGWTRFYPTAMPSTPRALWAWQHTDTHQLLAIGCETSAVSATTIGAPLELVHIEDGTKMLTTITPLVRQDNVSAVIATMTTSNTVTITDVGSNASQYDAVFVPAHISVGGILVFGFYQAIPGTADQFQVDLVDVEGNPVIPTSAVTAGVVATFTTTSGSNSVTVTLPDHGFVANDTYPVLVSTDVGGVTLEGPYTVLAPITTNDFKINAQNQATSSTSAAINGGLARYNFYVGIGPSVAGTGYGSGGYGLGGYGSGVTSTVAATGAPIQTADWTLDNWGNLLLACPTATNFGSPISAQTVGGPIYYWSHDQNTPTALAIAGGPVANAGFFVAMPQRQVVAYGSEEDGLQDPLLVRWSDVGNYLNWRSTPTNLAGSYRLSRGSRIVGGIQVGQQGLLITDVSAWVMRFIGSSGGTNQAYGFNEIARGCGLIAQKALAVLAGTAYWMGTKQFYVMGSQGNQGVQVFPCPLWDLIFDDLDLDNLAKIRMGANSAFGEFWLFYPSASGGGEVDKYVKCNTLIGPANGWDYGNLSRTAWLDQSVIGQPVGAEGGTKLLQQHETSFNADGQPLTPVFQTGFFVLQDGDLLSFVDQVWPDMRWNADSGTTPNAQLALTFYVKEYPGDTARTYGPFSLTNAVKYVTPRFRGRLVAFQLESSDVDSFWRLGGMRFRWQPAGKFL